jgi:hypothetical protein
MMEKHQELQIEYGHPLMFVHVTSIENSVFSNAAFGVLKKPRKNRVWGI